jgi:hypothetical protein
MCDDFDLLAASSGASTRELMHRMGQATPSNLKNADLMLKTEQH